MSYRMAQIVNRKRFCCPRNAGGLGFRRRRTDMHLVHQCDTDGLRRGWVLAPTQIDLN